MRLDDERAANDQPSVPTAEEAARRWKQGMDAHFAAHPPDDPTERADQQQRQILSMLGRIDYTLAEIKRATLATVDKVDHIHDDVMALREVCSIQRPECYPPAPARRRRRRAIKPPAAETPPPTSPQEPRSATEP